MSAVVVQHAYEPRAPFYPFHRRAQRFAALVAHRRAGKTVAVVNDLVVRAMRTQKPRAFYAYIAPYAGQARQVSWDYLKLAVRDIPLVKVHESNSTITLPNGARIRVFGADNADALRGLYFDGVVLDEFGDMAGRVWTEVIRPALSDRTGWAIFIGTPRGKNDFFQICRRARRCQDLKQGFVQPQSDEDQQLLKEDWFFMSLKASESGLLPEAELAAARLDMEEDEYRQEFECDFDATIRGSYYGKHLAQVIAKGGVCDVEVSRAEPVNLAMDIGYADATAIWFWQVVDGEVRFVDYWERSGCDADEVCEMLQLKPYRWGTWWLPHDARARTFASKKSVVETFLERDAPVRVLPKLDLKDGVDGVRKVLRLYPVKLDVEHCARGVEALKNYSHKFNPDTKAFSHAPNHDEWSHGADAFRYACQAITPSALEMSRERAAERRAKAKGDAAGLDSSGAYTFAQAWADHERELAQRAAAGRRRI